MMYKQEAVAETGWEHPYLEACFDRARMLQEALNETQIHADALALGSEFIPVIDGNFPYLFQKVHISGRGIFPVTDEQGIIDSESWGLSEGSFGTHHGFVVLDIAPEGSYDFRVMQKILVQETLEYAFTTLETRHRIFNYFELDSQILPHNEMESILSSHDSREEDSQNQLEIIDGFSKDFNKILRSTEFRRLKHRQQRRLVDDMLVSVNKYISIRDLQFMGEPEYGYAPFSGGSQRGFVALTLGDILIGGSCLGVDSIESALLASKAIRSDKDMADKYAGLCMVVDPDTDTRQALQLAESQVLYIPTYDQSFEAVLYHDN